METSTFSFDDIPTANGLGNVVGSDPLRATIGSEILSNTERILAATPTVDSTVLKKSGAEVLANAKKLVSARQEAIDNENPEHSAPPELYSVELPLLESTPITAEEQKSLADVNPKEGMTLRESLSDTFSGGFIKGIIVTIIITAIALIIAALMFRDRYTWLPTAKITITASVIALATLFIGIKIVKGRAH